MSVTVGFLVLLAVRRIRRASLQGVHGGGAGTAREGSGRPTGGRDRRQVTGARAGAALSIRFIS